MSLETCQSCYQHETNYPFSFSSGKQHWAELPSNSSTKQERFQLKKKKPQKTKILAPYPAYEALLTTQKAVEGRLFHEDPRVSSHVGNTWLTPHQRAHHHPRT